MCRRLGVPCRRLRGHERGAEGVSMTPPNKSRYWPFPVAKPRERWTDFDKSIIRFLETAYQLGFKPCVEGMDFCVDNASGRSAWVIRRGTRPWRGEIRMNGTGGGLAFVDDFDAITQAALKWLQGEALSDILTGIDAHVLRRDGKRWFRRFEPADNAPLAIVPLAKKHAHASVGMAPQDSAVTP